MEPKFAAIVTNPPTAGFMLQFLTLTLYSMNKFIQTAESYISRYGWDEEKSILYFLFAFCFINFRMIDLESCLTCSDFLNIENILIIHFKFMIFYLFIFLGGGNGNNHCQHLLIHKRLRGSFGKQWELDEIDVCLSWIYCFHGSTKFLFSKIDKCGNYIEKCSC